VRNPIKIAAAHFLDFQFDHAVFSEMRGIDTKSLKNTDLIDKITNFAELLKVLESKGLILVRRHINYITDVTQSVGPDLASDRARVGSRTDNSRPDTRSGPTILPVA
jgi:hypothetical protein